MTNLDMTEREEPPETPSYGFRSPHEHRLPATCAVIAAAALYLVLPKNLIVGPRWILPLLELALLIPLVLSDPTKITRESKDLRWLSVSLIALVNAANASNLFLLVHRLLHGGSANGRQLIYAAVAIWLTNVLVFTLWFWEVDRGGPYARCSRYRRRPDFLFPQMTEPGATDPPWVPNFIDYLYVSFTNALAFSPTDTMPLSTLAKTLMLTESLVSLITVVLVGARAVNVLN